MTAFHKSDRGVGCVVLCTRSGSRYSVRLDEFERTNDMWQRAKGGIQGSVRFATLDANSGEELVVDLLSVECIVRWTPESMECVEQGDREDAISGS